MGRTLKWQRFTERARRAIFFAQEEAARLGENCVGAEHLLLGLIRENDNPAAGILERQGVYLGRVRQDVERQVTRGNGRLGTEMPLTPGARSAIDHARDEARSLNDDYVGTEHLLLGLLHANEGIAWSVLTSLGVTLASTRAAVGRLYGKTHPEAESVNE